MNDLDKNDPVRSGCAGCFIGFLIMCVTTVLISIGGLLTNIFEIPTDVWAGICILSLCTPIIILIFARILGDR